jgi:hypothetical protein
MLSTTQMFKHKLPDTMDERDVDTAFAAYLAIFHDWLNQNFNGLKTYYGWQMFYLFLVNMTVEMINGEETDEAKKLNWENVVVPRWEDLCQWCRLLYQGIVPLRIAVIDGQHRMCAVLKILSGFHVILDQTAIPPKRFDHFGSPYDGEKAFGKAWSEITKTIPTVRTLVAKDSRKMEEYAKEYSIDLETSQTSKKQRNLVDV